MKLQPSDLLRKFPCLNKFKDQKWFSEEALSSDCNYKELPLKACLLLIKDMLEFIEKTKFTSRWEEGFSLKIRLQHAESLLLFFCEDSEKEKTLKGTNLLQQHPTD